MIPIPDFEGHIRRAMRELSDNTGATNGSRGSTVRALIEAVGRIDHSYLVSMIETLTLRSVSSSTGTSLDIIGDIVGVRRRASKRASADAVDKVVRFRSTRGTIGAINSSNPLTITSGTRILLRSHNTDGSTNIFRVLDNATGAADEEYVWVSTESELDGRAGSIGKGAMYIHDFESYSDVANDSLVVENLSPLVGEDTEDDDSFRRRIVLEKQRRGGSNSIAIELAAMSVPGVQDAKLIPYEAGAGTATCYIMATTGRTGAPLLAQARAAIQYYESPIADTIIVAEPYYVGAEIQTRVKFKDNVTSSDRRRLLASATEAVLRGVGRLTRGESRAINSISGDITRIVGPFADDIGVPNRAVERHWMWKQTEDGRRFRNQILGNYVVEENERLIIEDSIEEAVRITEWQ